MKKIILFILLAVSTNVFSGAYITGEILINRIKSNLVIDNELALGYIFGVVDSYDNFCKWKLEGITIFQLNQVTKNYLEKHPEIWNYSANYGVLSAIKEVYPCKK
jgi:hypothetical protein